MEHLDIKCGKESYVASIDSTLNKLKNFAEMIRLEMLPSQYCEEMRILRHNDINLFRMK